ncbi:hypothetical protein D3C81_1981920 [compost metagenome]
MAKTSQRGISHDIRLYENECKWTRSIAKPCHFACLWYIRLASVNNLHSGVAVIEINTLIQIPDDKRHVGKSNVHLFHKPRPSV